MREEAKKHEAILLRSQDGEWEGLFIDGALVEEGHHLGEGSSEAFWLDIGEKYGISGADLIIKEVNDKDDKELMECGGFYQTLAELTGNYRGTT